VELRRLYGAADKIEIEVQVALQMSCTTRTRAQHLTRSLPQEPLLGILSHKFAHYDDRCCEQAITLAILAVCTQRILTPLSRQVAHAHPGEQQVARERGVRRTKQGKLPQRESRSAPVGENRPDRFDGLRAKFKFRSSLRSTFQIGKWSRFGLGLRGNRRARSTVGIGGNMSKDKPMVVAKGRGVIAERE
jgi:hypothetical protein